MGIQSAAATAVKVDGVIRAGVDTVANLLRLDCNNVYSTRANIDRRKWLAQPPNSPNRCAAITTSSTLPCRITAIGVCFPSLSSG